MGFARKVVLATAMTIANAGVVGPKKQVGLAAARTALPKMFEKAGQKDLGKAAFVLPLFLGAGGAMKMAPAAARRLMITGTQEWERQVWLRYSLQGITAAGAWITTMPTPNINLESMARDVTDWIKLVPETIYATFHRGSDRYPTIDGPVLLHIPKKDRELLRHVTFTEKAIWARPLGGQWWMELSRACLDIITIGFFEFSRATAGSAYHWAFVLRGRLPEGMVPGWRPNPYVYLVCQDNMMLRSAKENGVVKKVVKANARKGIHTRFSMHLCYSTEEAAKVIGCGDKKGFVKHPVSAYGKNPRIVDDRLWRKCKVPRKLDDFIEAVKLNPCTKRRYSLDKNNCQHFASYMFHDVGDKSKVRINRRRGNPACI